MALKAVHVSDVPKFDHVPENSSFSLYSSRFSKGADVGRASFKRPKFLVIGHRGNGMNLLQSTDRRMKAVKENTILSFNTAGSFPVDFVEFDVQVTKDGCPIIFHDNFILSEENGTVYEKRVTELNLWEFLTYGVQGESGMVGKTLLRKTKDGKIVGWNVEDDDSSCTLQEAFHKVNPSLGFNIELKFDDHIVYQEEYLVSVLQAILQVTYENAKERPVIFSTFQPDAALLMKKLQNTYPVFFLTNGGNEIYYDVRRNSLEEAIKLCLEGGLQGIVSEVRGIFTNPGTVTKIKESKLSLLTYGKLNNVPEAVYMQHLMGIDGVIVDLVREITETVSNMMKPSEEAVSGEGQIPGQGKPQFSQTELTFLLKLIPELVQQ
ncbi:glycerophosphodiester phosphodiesterase GDPD1, chloroplastic-like [Olea europaea var. sylvestris]|uniref:glycerophosphodiester phosphodiesterase n=1 Tax=Olea europaea subsp. europaea TaxID=158383 RepID=A0A8S0QCY6_OLEEU|nr:glycerophosphodiester phosphodiesterase GDPD1, chloroplastic-like [Olea europaea var. sylvestris]CAA2964918.1 glycerophosphodiester phosphodiesterase GDPD1, chloroplastic-like [Olea europaea subsp. europaea]